MYAKVFSQIYDGTLCTKGPWQALVTFQQLLVLADQDGNVDMTTGAIARRTTIPLEIIELGIGELLKADPESRTPVADGKRIVPLSEGRAWGWQIVNYKHYRDLKREEDRRAYHREYWHKRKDKLNDSTKTQQPQPNQPIAEAKADTEAKKEKRSARGSRLPADWSAPDEWIEWARKERPELDPLKTALKFADFWHSKPGAGGCKLDWFATWRNWVREERAATSSGKSFKQKDTDEAKAKARQWTGGILGSPQGQDFIDMEPGNANLTIR